MTHHLGQKVLLACLWAGVMTSSLSVVFVTHRTRLATDELEMLRHKAADLQVESGQLLLEKSSLSAFARVEQKALNELEMIVPELNQIVVIKP